MRYIKEGSVYQRAVFFTNGWLWHSIKGCVYQRVVLIRRNTVYDGHDVHKFYQQSTLTLGI